jgi:hypothetical protein
MIVRGKTVSFHSNMQKTILFMSLCLKYHVVGNLNKLMRGRIEYHLVETLYQNYLIHKVKTLYHVTHGGQEDLIFRKWLFKAFYRLSIIWPGCHLTQDRNWNQIENYCFKLFIDFHHLTYHGSLDRTFWPKLQNISILWKTAVSIKWNLIFRLFPNLVNRSHQFT